MKNICTLLNFILNFIEQGQENVFSFPSVIYTFFLFCFLGAETTVSEVSLSQTPTCTQSVSSTNPTTLLDCSHNLTFSASTLTDGER